jgi:hypothetical protein
MGDKIMETKLESKLKYDISSSDYIEYYDYKLANAVQYFCYHQLKHIELKYLPYICIEIGSDCLDQDQNCNAISMWEGDTVFIGLSTQNIKENADSAYGYESPIKLLFHTFLHEFYHVYRLIEAYLKDENDINYEKIAAQRHVESLKERKKLRRQGIDLTEVDLNMDEEQAADWFAFQNLSLFENLYEHDHLYTPQKAFMFKVRKEKTKIHEKPILKIVHNQNNIDLS